MAIDISPLAQASQTVTSPTAQASGMAQRAAEMEQQPTELQSLASSTMDDVRQQREKLNQAVERMIASLDRRKSLPFDPMLMKVAAAFAKPTKTGSFGESMGYAAEAAAAEAEQEYARQQAQAKLEMELQQRLLEAKQKTAGMEMLQGMVPGGAPMQVAGGMAPTAPQAPAGVPGVRPGMPGGAPGAAPGVATAQGAAPGQTPQNAMNMLQEPILGIRPVTLQDIRMAEAYADPTTVKYLQDAMRAQQEQQKIGMQERALEFTIPGVGVTTKNIPLAKQEEIKQMFRQQGGVTQNYLRYLVNEGLIRPETVESEPGEESRLLPPLTPTQEKAAEKRAEKIAESEVGTRSDILKSGREAKTIVDNANTVIKYASDPSTSGGLGIFAGSGVLNAIGGLIESTMNVGGKTIGISDFSSAVRKVTKDEKTIDAAMFLLQPIANMELGYRRAFLSGSGAVSNMEQQLVSRIPPSISDSPRVIIAKSEMLKARGIYDQERAKLLLDWEKRNPRSSVEEFEFKDKGLQKLKSEYDAQLEKIGNTYFPPERPASKSTGAVGPLESQLRGQ